MNTPAGRRHRPGPSHAEVVHQALHGYDHGHRLLASSRGLDDEDLRLIDRLSDASGQHPVPDNDGYLTGYPLPSGRAYALARTWYVPEPPRPNVVWTHTLLVPHSALGIPDLDGLLALLRKPRRNDAANREPYRLPLTPPAAGLGPAAADPDRAAARDVLSELYRPGAVTAVSALEGRERRDTLCMAVWNQQWPRLRRHFSFCSGALEPRRAAAGPFDLLLMPAHHGNSGPTSTNREPLRPHVLAALTADLGEPGPLREFLRACGPDSARRRVMPLLVEAYVTASGGEPAAAIRQVTVQVPKAASMRRLKRALLNPQDDLLRHAKPIELLDALLGPDVAEHILVADANLVDWAARAWERKPAAVLAALPAEPLGGPALEAAGEKPAPRGEGAGSPTVAQAARRELSTVVERSAEPRHLAAIAGRQPALAAGLVTGRDDEAWWSAWALLPAVAFQHTLATGRFDEPPGLLRAVAALTHEALGPARWRALRDRIGAAAVAALLAQPRRDGPWRQALGERLDLLAEALRSGLSAAQVAAACNAAPDLAFVRDVGFGPLTPLAAAPRLWQQEPRHAAVVLAAALDATSGQADTAVADVYGWLYERFAGDGAWDAWELLEPALPGKHDDWDRCKRLARGVGDAVRGKNGPARPAVLAAVPAGPARDALQAQLERGAARKAAGESAQPQQDAWDGMIRLFWPW